MAPFIPAFAATLGFLSVGPCRPAWQTAVVGLYVFFGYALPEARFLGGRLDRPTANATLETAGFLGTIVAMVLGLPKFEASPSAGLNTFALALVTTLVAEFFMLVNLQMERRQP